jgi:hypothetical protein
MRGVLDPTGTVAESRNLEEAPSTPDDIASSP